LASLSVCPAGGELRLTAPLFAVKPSETGGIQMPTMSNLRRRKIQARQRKAENAAKREAKIAKKEQNAKKAG